MFSPSFVALLVLFAHLADARFQWLERKSLNPRRFGQEHPAVIEKLSAACPGQICGVLSGQAITPLLAAQPECSQQDMADQIIDAARQFDAATQTNMIALAVEYRQAEKNTPPDFSTNPPTLRNSVFCQKAPKNKELVGLVQAQDPANNPNVFFDPATGKSVTKGSQSNTEPFKGAGVSNNASGSKAASAAPAATQAGKGNNAAQCPTPKTVTVVAQPTATAKAVASSNACPAPKTVTVTRGAAAASATAISQSSSSTSNANLQTFSGALGGVTPPPVTALGGGNFQVTGNAQFNNLQNALVRSCDVQHNQCANKANATGNKGDLTVTACGTQQDACIANARKTAQ